MGLQPEFVTEEYAASEVKFDTELYPRRTRLPGAVGWVS